jgi:diguanylate cyclase (GGDEF)-like protein/PAS domain S-box-containing protein
MKNEISPHLLRRAVSDSHDGVAIVDARLHDMPLVYVNQAFERLTGYSAREVLGKNCRFLHRDDVRQEGLGQVREALKGSASCVTTLRNYRKDGSMFWNELRLTPLLNRFGQLTHVIGVLYDVTSRVTAEQQLLEKQRQLEKTKRMLEELALRDGLTDLYNRRHFNEQLRREWNRARREHLPLTLFMVDIDHFKQYNDTHGHLAGDECIRAVAQRVRSCFTRGSDLVARYGGEEFVALACGLERRHARERAERVREEAIMLPNGEPAGVTVSVGLATATPAERFAPEDLLNAADQALYQAKHQGRNRVVQAPALRALAHAA